MEPEQLAAKMLFLLRKRGGLKSTLNNLEQEMWSGYFDQPHYPPDKRNDALGSSGRRKNAS
jgi:hypothetical protein